MKQRKKTYIFYILGIIFLLLGFIFTGLLISEVSQEATDLIRETVFGIFTMLFLCSSTVMFISSYLVKEFERI